jgi:type I restriction enzyme S subunit
MTWHTIELGRVMDVKHGYAFKSEGYSDNGELLLLTPGNCHETGGLKLRGEKDKFYVGEFPQEYLLAEGDMLVVMTDLVNSAPILGGSLVIPDNNRFLHNQRLGLVQITDDSRVDRSFLYYLLNTREYRAQVRGSASGATVRHTSPDRIRACRLRVPVDVAKQRKIGDVLSAYDYQLMTNRRRITLLEESARHLYCEWFVRLRFPGREHVRVSNRIPVGWQPTTFGSHCEQIRDIVSPEAMEPDTPYVGLEHIPRRSISLSEWGSVEEVSSSKHRYREGDILFGKIRPYFHKVGIAFTDGVASSDAIVIRPKDAKLLPLVLMTASSDPFVAATSQTMREGAKMPRADWKQMQAYTAPTPPDGLLQSFNDFVNPILAQLKTLAFMNRHLKAARDLLLPRLMSGEVTV